MYVKFLSNKLIVISEKEIMSENKWKLYKKTNGKVWKILFRENVNIVIF